MGGGRKSCLRGTVHLINFPESCRIPSTDGCGTEVGLGDLNIPGTNSDLLHELCGMIEIGLGPLLAV